MHLQQSDRNDERDFISNFISFFTDKSDGAVFGFLVGFVFGSLFNQKMENLTKKLIRIFYIVTANTLNKFYTNELPFDRNLDQ